MTTSCRLTRLMTLLVTLTVVVADTMADEATPNQDSTQGQSLFDGRTLDGWEGDKRWFEVRDGAIVAGSMTNAIPHNQFLCTTETFADFELSLQIKLVGPGKNAGVQFRSRREPGSTEVIGYQADAGQAWNKPVWGGLYDESRRREMLCWPDLDKLNEVLAPEDWNTMTIRAVGDHIQIRINDVVTTDYHETDDSIARDGIIGLQIHSGPPSEAWYRDIRVVRLNEAKP